MATFWEIAAHSVKHMFSFVFLLFVILAMFRFGFEGWNLVLIASVPDLCILLTFEIHNSWDGLRYFIVALPEPSI